MELTRSEMEIMDVLWASDAPLSRADLLAHSEEKTWKDSSVHILLNGLLQKGAIQEAGLVKRSKTYGRVFSPTLSREEYFLPPAQARNSWSVCRAADPGGHYPGAAAGNPEPGGPKNQIISRGTVHGSSPYFLSYFTDFSPLSAPKPERN